MPLITIINFLNPFLQDPYWCSLVQYSVANSAFTGCELPSLVDPNIKVSKFHCSSDEILMLRFHKAYVIVKEQDPLVLDTKVCTALSIRHRTLSNWPQASILL